LLLAFARMHEQAVARRRQHHSGTPQTPPDEYFGLDEVLRLVAVRAAAITAADGIAVALASEDAIVCRASFGRISPDPGVRLDPHSGFSGACLRHGQTVRCDDSETDSRVNLQACRSLGARSMVAVPLTAKGRVVGLLEAFSSKPLGFNESDVGSLNLLGELILAAMHPAEEDRLVQLAGQILPEPPQPEPERPAEAGGTFTEEAASAPAAVDSDLAGPPVAEALVGLPDSSKKPPVQSKPGHRSNVRKRVVQECRRCLALHEQLTELWRSIIQTRREQAKRRERTKWSVGYLQVAEANDLVDRVVKLLSETIEKPKVPRNSPTNNNTLDPAATDDRAELNSDTKKESIQ
jgi:hypothetical protein